MTVIVSPLLDGNSTTAGSFTVPTGVTSGMFGLFVFGTAAGTTIGFVLSKVGATFTNVDERTATNLRVAIIKGTGLVAGDTVNMTATNNSSWNGFCYFTDEYDFNAASVSAAVRGVSSAVTASGALTPTSGQRVVMVACERTTATGTTVSSVTSSGGETVTQIGYVEDPNLRTNDSFYFGSFIASAAASRTGTITYSGGSTNGYAALLTTTPNLTTVTSDLELIWGVRSSGVSDLDARWAVPLVRIRALSDVYNPATTAAQNDGNAVTLGIEFTVSAPVYLNAIRWFAPTTGTLSGLPREGRLWSTADGLTGTELASTPALPPVGGGWQSLPISGDAVLLSPGTVYRVGVFYPAGRFLTSTANYWSSGTGSAGIVRGPLAMPNATNALGNDQNPYVYGGTPLFPTQSASSSIYWIEPEVRNAQTSNLNSDLDTRWAVRSAVNSDLDIRWTVRNTATSDLDTRWAVRSSAVSDLDCRWRVRSAVTSDLDTWWAVRNLAASDLDIRWAVRASATSSLDVRWAVRAEANTNLDLRWVTTGALTIGRPPVVIENIGESAPAGVVVVQNPGSGPYITGSV